MYAVSGGAFKYPPIPKINKTATAITIAVTNPGILITS
jgi:hypothetical protein